MVAAGNPPAAAVAAQVAVGEGYDLITAETAGEAAVGRTRNVE